MPQPNPAVGHVRRVCLLPAALALLLAQPALAFGPLPVSLKGVPIPEVPGLSTGVAPIVVDEAKAIALGKALFWDQNVGSDGMACASCHFHAGADSRVKNQLAPSGISAPAHDQVFDDSPLGASRGANYTLTRSDFPFHQRVDPLDTLSAVLYDSDDVASSSGTFGGRFIGTSRFKRPEDRCERSVDSVFHVGGAGTRRVEPRNAPTVINSIFNHRNFWDGRANNIFNGSSLWGDRDPEAGVWVVDPQVGMIKQSLHLVNSSIASLSVQPPVSDVEMGCDQRSFAALARKLIGRRPLENQDVHWNDSVLGRYSRSRPGKLKKGLNTRYRRLIRAAFDSKYWSKNKRFKYRSPAATDRSASAPRSQMEANFPMFFALSIQVYLSTLVSDEAPFDRSARDTNGAPIDLSEQQQRGFHAFREAHCSLCHLGPNLTAAAVETNAILAETDPNIEGTTGFRTSVSRNVVSRDLLTEGTAFVDTGFASNGTAGVVVDIGLGGYDPFGHPLSFSDQYLQFIAGNAAGVIDSQVTDMRPCDLQIPIAFDSDRPHPVIFTSVDGIIPQSQDVVNCFSPVGTFLPSPAVAAAELANPDTAKMLAVNDGVFKIPTLRNIELTGPYMHNGGMASLEEVIEFYTRGGNVGAPGVPPGKVFALGILNVSPQKRADIVAFLKTLTDERVRYQRAPFDHPGLTVPHGHSGDNRQAVTGNTLDPALAIDEFMVIEAVGAEGATGPLLPFEQLLTP